MDVPQHNCIPAVMSTQEQMTDLPLHVEQPRLLMFLNVSSTVIHEVEEQSPPQDPHGLELPLGNFQVDDRQISRQCVAPLPDPSHGFRLRVSQP